MTKTEFDAWKKATNHSIDRWQIDPIHNGKGRDLLAFRGGANGRFIRIDLDGKVTIGSYEGAVPHVGEAVFTDGASVKCADFDEAVKRLLEVGGLDFLRDILS